MQGCRDAFAHCSSPEVGGSKGTGMQTLKELLARCKGTGRTSARSQGREPGKGASEGSQRREPEPVWERAAQGGRSRTETGANPPASHTTAVASRGDPEKNQRLSEESDWERGEGRELGGRGGESGRENRRLTHADSTCALIKLTCSFSTSEPLSAQATYACSLPSPTLALTLQHSTRDVCLV